MGADASGAERGAAPDDGGDIKRQRIGRSKDALGWRAKIACIAPSTNTIVQPDFENIASAIPGRGVTNHMGRITIPNMDLSSDEGMLRLLAAVGSELDAAAERCMSASCDYMAMGMSAPTFFGGYEECVRKRAHMEKVCGVGVSSGSFACEAALKAFGCKRIAVLSPYQKVGDVEVTRFFTEAGFTVVRFKGLRCPTPIAIAEVGEAEMRQHLTSIDGGDVDALVQVGTNLSCVDLAATLEQELDKPVIAINVATYWHALRALGIDDKLQGFGRLMSEH
jgi:maleate isomerase